MGDLTVEVTVMHSVSAKAKRASAEFGSEPALSGAHSGCLGSDVAASAFVSSARAQDAMIRSLGQDADTLGGFVEEAAATLLQADEGLAVKVQ
ncbi:hypothetical protein [Curtobacterium sp. MCBA15_001]|uniref:hypothetical protein n=1 Tax=Curtobacterium sp. MCBA15_001 TaxID=1898731 RepID=UPI0008DE61EA|nr:hypothetical protein [Curtobacterium sp. MCBA15_001]OIH96553.1 hypothetical protein BIU90_17070 [Curtobacterium sp. MCBA15_001]